jgi:hypothetical protein
MKKKLLYSLASLLLLGSALNSPAALNIGNVYCDANTNGIIDRGDSPAQSVLAVATNMSGTFSNGSWTTAEGIYVIDLSNTPDTYVNFVLPATLPPGTTAVLPFFHTFTVSNEVVVTNNFLLENSNCVAIASTNSGQCWLTGGGTIKSGKGKPLFNFGGAVNPGCSTNVPGGGNWHGIDFTQKLHFKTVSIEVVDCGNTTNSSRSLSSFIEFQGVGTLTGIAGNKADFGVVNFFAHAEDFGQPGKAVDRLYVRVFDGSGNTLLLISADTSNPLDIAPVTISTGNLKIHSCN